MRGQRYDGAGSLSGSDVLEKLLLESKVSFIEFTVSWLKLCDHE